MLPSLSYVCTTSPVPRDTVRLKYLLIVMTLIVMDHVIIINTLHGNATWHDTVRHLLHLLPIMPVLSVYTMKCVGKAALKYGFIIYYNLFTTSHLEALLGC